MFVVNGSTPTITFKMVSVADHITAVTGNAANIQPAISKNGGAFASTTAGAAEIANGWYSVALTATETNTDGDLIIRCYDTAGTATMDEWGDLRQVVTTFSATLSSAERNAIADHTIRRAFQNACDSANGDAKSMRSLLGAIAKLVNKTALVSTTLSIYEDDDITALGSQTISTGAGPELPVIGLDTN